MRFIFAFLTILYIAPWAGASEFTDRDVEEVLLQLDREIPNRESHMQWRINHLDSLKVTARAQLANDTLGYLETTMRIAKGYNSFNNDSALVYYTRGYDMALEAAAKLPKLKMKADSMATEFRARRATYLSLSGFMHDALIEYNDIDTTGMQPGLRASYLDAGRQMCYYISNFYSGWFDSYEYWNNRSVEAQRQLIPLLDPSSDQYLLSAGEYYYNMREYNRAREMLLRLINHIPVESPMYAIAAHTLASIALTRGDRNEYLFYLTRSAISDLRQATLEVTSIQELAAVLYEMGQTNRAHEYVSVALQNAVESRASVRMMPTTELLSIVEEDHNMQIARWRSRVYAFIVVLVLALLALGVAVLYIRKELSRVSRLRSQLQEANAMKDIYIGQFLQLSSVYMDKLKGFTKLVSRKISAGQTDELYKMSKSGKFIDEISTDFYKVFDDAFLHIYPNFVEGVNELLRPEERIILDEGEKLNSDLRILAFMRLGISDTNRVAQILNFSVNTIYAYRNRLRNRAINRDTFEQDIMRLGSLK